jgi:hypothetical protein
MIFSLEDKAKNTFFFKKKFPDVTHTKAMTSALSPSSKHRPLFVL